MTSKSEKERRMQIRRKLGNRKAAVTTEWVRQRTAPYLIAHACFYCRTSFKVQPCAARERSCPNCTGRAYEMGRSFKAPPKADIEQWFKVQALFAHGFRFFSYRSYDWLDPKDADAAHNAVLRALDHALGEEGFAASVQFTEVAPLPANGSPDDYIPLRDLERFIEWRARRREGAG
jgi:hypothetical protein